MRTGKNNKADKNNQVNKQNKTLQMRTGKSNRQKKQMCEPLDTGITSQRL